jgi:hypothetical protein
MVQELAFVAASRVHFLRDQEMSKIAGETPALLNIQLTLNL